jgi:hypothetical protein
VDDQFDLSNMTPIAEDVCKTGSSHTQSAAETAQHPAPLELDRTESQQARDVHEVAEVDRLTVSLDSVSLRFAEIKV